MTERNRRDDFVAPDRKRAEENRGPIAAAAGRPVRVVSLEEFKQCLLVSVGTATKGVSSYAPC